jgi:hypothetical protein
VVVSVRVGWWWCRVGGGVSHGGVWLDWSGWIGLAGLVWLDEFMAHPFRRHSVCGLRRAFPPQAGN